MSAAVFLLAAANLFSQDEMSRGSIPEELLRPRRDESPRYPIDTVIGELGQGNAPQAAYDCARRAANAFLSGTAGATVFSYADKIFIESCINALNTISPRYFRLGGGREEPDGSVSFLVRFAGRNEGITGELFIRQNQRRIPVAVPDAVQNEEKSDSENKDNPEDDEGEEIVETAPEQPVRTEILWAFEDIILEEARSRDAENEEGRHRFDFSPYERFF
jgi:hypothetical protein